MVENKLPFAEGASIPRSPMFSAINYQFWKIRTKIFIESIDQGIWDAIVNLPYTPKHDVDNKQVTHEGTIDVKRVREHALIQEHELFKMQQGESMAQVQKRFTHIANHLIGLGKEFEKEELNIKVLKCLDKSWQPKVMTILKLGDHSTMIIDALFGKLRKHEIEMQRVNEQESSEKNVKTIALKSYTKKSDEPNVEVVESNDNENLNVIVKRFGK